MWRARGHRDAEGRNHLAIEAVAVELDGVGRKSTRRLSSVNQKLSQYTNLREGCDFVVGFRVRAIAQRLLEGLFSGVAGSSTALDVTSDAIEVTH